MSATQLVNDEIYTKYSNLITKEWAFDRVYNSRRPLDRLQYVFALCEPAILTHCDLLTHWWARYRDGLYLCQIRRF